MKTFKFSNVTHRIIKIRQFPASQNGDWARVACGENDAATLLVYSKTCSFPTIWPVLKCKQNIGIIFPLLNCAIVSTRFRVYVYSTSTAKGSQPLGTTMGSPPLPNNRRSSRYKQRQIYFSILDTWDSTNNALQTITIGLFKKYNNDYNRWWKILSLYSASTLHWKYLLYSWQRTRAGWTKSCVVIGYPRGKDGASSYLARSGLPVSSAPLFTVNPYNKSIISQACLVKMARYPGLVLFLHVQRKCIWI